MCAARSSSRCRPRCTLTKARLDKEVAQLDGRVAKLDESARSLETGLDKRLGQMASNTMGDVRKQMESAVDEIMIELETRSSRELGARVDIGMRTVARHPVGNRDHGSALPQHPVAETLRAFAQSMEELERESVERLRTTLAGGLNSVIRGLGDNSERRSSFRKALAGRGLSPRKQAACRIAG